MFDTKPYQRDLVRLCERFGVEELSLFGSALRQDFDALSDLDFAVIFAASEPTTYAQRYFGFIEGLEALFERHVDLVSLKAVENPYLRATIEASKETLYATPG